MWYIRPCEGVGLGGVALTVYEDGHLITTQGQPVVMETGDRGLQLLASREQVFQVTPTDLKQQGAHIFYVFYILSSKDNLA